MGYQMAHNNKQYNKNKTKNFINKLNLKKNKSFTKRYDYGLRFITTVQMKKGRVRIRTKI